MNQHGLKNNFQKNKKFILAGAISVLVVILSFSYCSAPVKNSAQKNMMLTIPALGQLPALHEAMRESAKLHGNVKEILSYDEAYLFVNYPQINALVTETMFLWSGLTPAQIKTGNRQKMAEYFIRYVYGLPADEPIRGNPLLEKKPWAGFFQKIKAKILMQGQGHKVFDGVAYYDSEKDRMIVQGGLSIEYLQNLSEFILTQPKEKQKSYFNNYLIFIDNTLGLKNLNDEERTKLKELGYI